MFSLHEKESLVIQSNSAVSVRGSLAEIVRNDDGMYEGNLVHYFRVLWNFAQNLRNPYHNFRHILHVMYLCWCACRFYSDSLTPRQMRNLLIAALFHDFDHPGNKGHDDLNIARAVRGLRKHLLSEDEPHVEDIVALIQATEYPYTVDSKYLELSALILRDADMGQAFSVAWIQQVVFGLSAEWSMTPTQLMEMQPKFIGGIRFHTEWGRETFSQADLQSKIREAEELLEILRSWKKVDRRNVING